MPSHLHIDFETFSEVDIRKVGAYRYAFDPSTEILCCAFALGDESPGAWWQGMREPLVPALKPYWDALRNPDVLIFAHNAMFEAAIMQALLEKTWGIPCPALSRFRCTMSLARRAALPSKLEKLAEVLELKHQKDKRGKKLIDMFSKVNEWRVSKKHPEGGFYRIRPEDKPEEFLEFVEYCRQDIRAEREAAHRLAYFDEPINNANYSLDAVINARGVPVNLTALRHAQTLVDEETELVSDRFRELCGFEVTQNAKLLEWANNQGVTFLNLQAETIDSYLENWDAEHHCEKCNDIGFTGTDEDIDVEGTASCPDCGGSTLPTRLVQALRMKQSIAYASIKKIATMLQCAGPHDNRIRGMLNHHGATTGRWTASLVQFQNMKRASDHMGAPAWKILPDGSKIYPHEPGYKESEGIEVKWSEAAYRDICNDISREMLELTYGPVLEVISSCIRHFVHDC
jgi:DNA polymerase bacteriophage-type